MEYDKMDFTDARTLRMIAEEQLNKDQNIVNPVSEADTKKLVHELQVHQIELEMQNEELLHAYDTAEKALKKYTMLYDFAPLGYFMLNSEGSICDLNFTAAEMLDDRRSSLLNSNFKLFVSDASKKVFDTFFSNVFVSNLKESCEVQLGYDNKTLCLAYIEGIVTDEDQKCLMSVVDISRFKK